MSRIEIIPPVVHREFLVRSRAPITYWLRLGAAGTAFVVIVIAVSFSLISGTTGGLSNGAGWFAFFGWCLWIFCLAEGVRQSFDMFSGEKREGTIGLLFLTQMRGLDVVLGKVSAGFIASFFPVLGALPILGILILLGGVSGAEFVRMSAALLDVGSELVGGDFCFRPFDLRRTSVERFLRNFADVDSGVDGQLSRWFAHSFALDALSKQF